MVMIICEIFIIVIGTMWVANPSKIVEQQNITRLKKGKPVITENEMAKKLNSTRMMGIVFALIGAVALIMSFMGF